ncbi:hypothetical protein [Helicobacter sp. MIT 01-3238]|uniref:hypothetical protein n=1 Tax=Helicobacter sp. MIT 01-3238 TaxID=398627 RepID=UPI0015F18B32|nr:hypothetical protein [Helicobacter sp. MIT 01-3238]
MGWVSFPSLRGSGFSHNEKQSINPSLRENPQGFLWQSTKVKEKSISVEKGNST